MRAKGNVDWKRHANPERVQITLYDLIEAINEEMRPGEEKVLLSIVKRLLNSGRVRLADSIAHSG